MDDPESLDTPRYIEMPAPVKGLETIDGIVYAVLEGGATIPINGLLDSGQSPDGRLQ